VLGFPPGMAAGGPAEVVGLAAEAEVALGPEQG
jgi:hypothetical protein